MKSLLRFRSCLTTAACFAEVRKSLPSQKACYGALSMTYSLVIMAESLSVFQQLSRVCSRRSDRLNCTCVALMHLGFTLLTLIDVCWWEQILLFQVISHVTARQLWLLRWWLVENNRCEIPDSKPHEVNKTKSHFCICLISLGCFPFLVIV